MSEMNKRAARPWGKALLFQAQSALYDEVADQTIALYDDLTGPSVDPQYTPGSIGEDSGWEFSSVTEGPYAGTGLVKLQNAGGTVTYVNFATGVMIDGEKVELTAAQAQAAVDDANAVAAEPDGTSVMAKLPDAAKTLADTPAKTQKYDAAKAANKVALQEMFARAPEPPTDDVKARVRQAKGSQDGSRISKEYHEWKYSLVESGDWVHISTLPAGEGVEYTGSEGVTIPDETPEAPPYYKWVQLDALREVIKIYRRHKRAWSKCGSTRLMTAEGHANKRAAIQATLAMDVEFYSACSALSVDADFTLT